MGAQASEVVMMTSMINATENYASEGDTKELIRIGKLPVPLRLAEMLEKTMQWPLHGKAADCLRRMHAELESLRQSVGSDQ
jgi:hypothetical protein